MMARRMARSPLLLLLLPPQALIKIVSSSASSAQQPVGEDGVSCDRGGVDALLAAWESHPLLLLHRKQPHLSASSTDGNGGDSSFSSSSSTCLAGVDDDEDDGNSIPTSSLLRPSNGFAVDEDEDLDLTFDPSNFFSLDDVVSLLSQPGLTYGTDFKLLKKVIRDGEEWNGMLPPHLISSSSGDADVTVLLDGVSSHLFRGGFSLVFDKVQRRWGPVSTVTRRWQRAVRCWYVSVNLYLTPQVPSDDEGRDSAGGNGGGDALSMRRSGFEAHWDWMDVVVVQITGKKLWTVANRPTVMLSYHDQKRRPTRSEMERYANGGGAYDDFLLTPGDVLYIPRGHVHNASTVSDSEVAALLGAIPGEKLQGEEDAASMPSLHLTLGIEHGCETTVEALIHHALDDFFDARRPDLQNAAVLDGDQGSSCSDVGVQWGTALHLYLAAVARRSGPNCDRGNGACGLLRRGATPLHHRRRRPGNGGSAEDDYLRAVDAVAAVVSSTKDNGGGEGDPTALLVELASTLVESSEEVRSAFCYPAMPGGEYTAALDCPTDLGLPSVRRGLPKIMLEFTDYARERYGAAQARMARRLEGWWDEAATRDDSDLAGVGQTGPVN